MIHVIEKERFKEENGAPQPKEPPKKGAKEREDEDIDIFMKMTRENVVIYAKNVIKDYEIGDYIVRAVDDITLEVREGEFITIIGPSGAGKTTLLNLIGGLDKPTKGEIYSFGVKITDMEAESLATFRLINSGFIFQNYNLISSLSAEENVIFPMSLAGIELSKSRQKAVDLLDHLGLFERREHLPFQLSAGEQQRVAIARSLANDTPVILADEPTANIDVKTSKFISSIFRELKEEGKTIIITTHDNKLIDLADRILTFDDGKIVNEEVINPYNPIP